MVTAYEYSSIVKLEAFAGLDYSAILARFTDPMIEAVISQGEREINGRTGVSYTAGSIPDVIESIATDLAYKRMYNRMVWEGLMDRENPKKRLMPLWDKETVAYLQTYIDKDLEDGVDLIRLDSGRFNNYRSYPWFGGLY